MKFVFTSLVIIFISLHCESLQYDKHERIAKPAACKKSRINYTINSSPDPTGVKADHWSNIKENLDKIVQSQQPSNVRNMRTRTVKSTLPTNLDNVQVSKTVRNSSARNVNKELPVLIDLMSPSVISKRKKPKKVIHKKTLVLMRSASV